MFRRRLNTPDFQAGDMVIDTTTGRVGKVVRKGPQISEVRWPSECTLPPFTNNRYLVKHELEKAK